MRGSYGGVLMDQFYRVVFIYHDLFLVLVLQYNNGFGDLELALLTPDWLLKCTYVCGIYIIFLYGVMVCKGGLNANIGNS